MNVLAADSGASKTDWVLISNGERQFVQTEGLNPHLVTPGEFLHILSKELKPNLMGKPIDAIHFFGSGCGSPEKKKNVAGFLGEVFSGAEIFVKTDLDGAGLALFGSREGIVCILGTGSSAGFFSEGKIIKQMPSLGYPEGDEGSGSDIGKRLLIAYLSDEMNKDLREYLEQNMDMGLNEIFEQVQEPKTAKLFAARVCRVMSKKSRYPEMQQIIYNGFYEFLEQVKEFFPDKIRGYSLGFGGSIASVYEGELRACAKQLDVEISSVIRSPIEHIAFHFSR